MVGQRSILLSEPSQVGEARRRAAELAAALGFDETTVGKASIVATELATNVIKHAKLGQLLLRNLDDAPNAGLELMALDNGPGIANLSESMRDGYSTAGSPGTGMGAVSRLADFYDIYTAPGAGTVLLAQLQLKAADRREHRTVTGAVCVPKPGEEFCGDAFRVIHQSDRELLILADGLGHGPQAARAAHEAIRVAEEHPTGSPGEILGRMQGPLRSTRGASVAVAEVKIAAGIVRYAGVGNISASISTGESTRSLVSHNGTVGHELHKVQEFSYPWTSDSLLVMHSDGLQSRWCLGDYPGLRLRHPSVVAGVLYRDFQRGRDDTTVVVLRQST